jgi:hypothetical protein
VPYSQKTHPCLLNVLIGGDLDQLRFPLIPLLFFRAPQLVKSESHENAAGSVDDLGSHVANTQVAGKLLPEGMKAASRTTIQ